ncbi:unnamed protein product, partial [Brassica napus]
QGIPVHLWAEETIKSIGDDLRIYEKAEITSSSVRMRVQVNGRLPLMMKYIIDYSNGEEVTASLKYKRLEKHCSKCFRLDHDIKDCLEAKAQFRALKEKQEDSSKSIREGVGLTKTGNSSFRFEAQPSLEVETRKYHDRYYQNKQKEHSTNSYRSRQQNFFRSRDDRSRDRELYPTSSAYRPSHTRDRERPPRPPLERGHNHHSSNFQWRPRIEANAETSREPVQVSPPHRLEEASSSPILPSPPVRGVPLQSNQAFDPHVAMEEAIGEVRAAMNQYTMCADPSESAARKERLRQAEERGEIEETASLMVQTSLQTRPPPPCEEPSPTSGERLSALQRLGPLIPNSETTRTSNAESPVKRKPGRPPGRRVVSASPKKILGTNTTKRRTTNAKPPTSRRRLAAETSQQNRATKLSAVRAGAS